MSYETTQHRATRQRCEESLGQGHKRLLAGTQFASWRTLPRRRALVLAAGAGLAVYLTGIPIHRAWITLAGLVAFLAAGFLIRVTTRGVADLPASALDERQLMVRNAVYIGAYRVVGGLIGLLATVCVLLSVAGQEQLPLDLSLHVLSTGLFAALVTPSCLVAWTEREL